MIATFAFKSRTKFSVQFVWDLSTTFRDLNAVTVQLKTGKCLKIKEWLSGLQMPGDMYTARRLAFSKGMTVWNDSVMFCRFFRWYAADLREGRSAIFDWSLLRSCKPESQKFPSP